MEDPATSTAAYESLPEYGTLLILLVVIVSSVLRMVKRVINLPVVAITVLWGFLAGWLVNRYGDKETFLPVTDANVGELLHLYMPVLVFTVTLNVRYHIFWRCFWQCVLLGGVGLVLSVCMFVLYMTFMVPSNKEGIGGRDPAGGGPRGPR
ncbi:hypothetical protein MTO96_002474 [Rhipicephalus appendiculatus]